MVVEREELESVVEVEGGDGVRGGVYVEDTTATAGTQEEMEGGKKEMVVEAKVEVVIGLHSLRERVRRQMSSESMFD